MTNQLEEDYEARRRIRAERNRRMRKNKRRQQMVRKAAPFLMAIIVVGIVFATVKTVGKNVPNEPKGIPGNASNSKGAGADGYLRGRES